ncbi:hypothetical protein EST38_g9616 [Candolleomyces aberdarensis]|uniref:C2H2-type domain-containing protein n=1 Tax=Candolleomyces aberdarensis TaxID=2316362 RepID=A0A4Q2DBT8_9AGAR|nr:hypothetical protein EST38_g9616 [Candolleomyces aberdarensis]
MPQRTRNDGTTAYDSEILHSFPCPQCPRVCKSRGGRTQHMASAHAILSSDSGAEEFSRMTILHHPKLTGEIVDKNGVTLPPDTAPPPREPYSANAWYPFNNRLEFDFAHYHYVKLQTSEANINTALDHWKAVTIAALGSAEDVSSAPWNTAQEVYSAIDEIQEGGAPFRTVHLRYQGEKPLNPPSWMTDTFEFCFRDARLVLQQQLENPEFINQFETVPYPDWIYREADTIAADQATHGAMVVPIVSGLDKTTVSVATGHQEYHPFYISAGNLTNLARRSHGSGVVPVAFLPIPKVSKRQKKRKEFKTFARQLYHCCIRLIFEPLRSGMTKPEIMRCPDGHFRRSIFSIGPVIADYPEQVWLAAIVQNWCPKDLALPNDLDDDTATRRTHEKTDFLVKYYDRAFIWDSFGVRDDVVPFTHSFPRADIHELLSPDLLHQVIKGTFKDHLVTWINSYINSTHPRNEALEIIQDIDRRISAVPSYPGLRRFPDGRDFAQWTGDDSKALMKVYLAAVVEYIPDDMTRCLASFLEACYIFRRNAITSTALKEAELHLDDFRRTREIFVATGVRAHCSLPRQHALKHFPAGVTEFGAPNGLCSSITESRHITAVKEPWRRSSRFNALSQMLTIIVRLDKISSLQQLLFNRGMLQGSTSAYMALTASNGWQPLEESSIERENTESWDEDSTDGGRPNDVGPAHGPRAATSVILASTHQRNYPRGLEALAQTVGLPQFTEAFLDYLFRCRFPTQQLPENLAETIFYTGRVYVHHSAGRITSAHW